MKKRSLLIVCIAVAAVFAACGGLTDDEITNRAQNALKGEPATSNVVVQVRNGVATLTGEVKDDASKAKAAELARVEGVSAVMNNVTVTPAPPPLDAADDAALRTKIEEALKEQGCIGAEVDVADGRVTIRGTVSQAKYPVCIMTVQVAKPRDLDNQLKSGE